MKESFGSNMEQQHDEEEKLVHKPVSTFLASNKRIDAMHA